MINYGTSGFPFYNLAVAGSSVGIGMSDLFSLQTIKVQHVV